MAERRTQILVGGVLAAAIIVVAAIAISQSGGGGGSSSDVTDQALVAKQLQGIPQHGDVLGDPHAKVTVTEFGDPQCPVCAVFSEQVVSHLIAGPVRSGEAKYEFRPWLIIGPDSKPAAEAALAAGEQDHFFNYIELFYRNQGEENSGYVTDDFLTAIANGANVPDIDKWNTDRASFHYDRVFAATNSAANSLGFSGTPSVEVVGPKGRKVAQSSGGGVPTEADIAAAIKAVS